MKRKLFYDNYNFHQINPYYEITPPRTYRIQQQSESSSSSESDLSENLDFEYNDFYIDLCKIIGHPNYFKNGLDIDIDDNEYNKNWYITSTIKFQSKLSDKITLWKHIKEDIWDEKILSVKEILQLNGID